MLNSDEQKRVGKALQAVAKEPAAMRSALKEQHRGGSVMTSLIDADLAGIFLYSSPPSSDEEAADRARDVTSELSKKSSGGPLVKAANLVTDVVRSIEGVGTVQFWHGYFQVMGEHQTRQVMEFSDHLADGLSTVGNILRSDLESRLVANSLSPSHLDEVVSALHERGVQVVSDLPSNVYRALENRGASNVVELILPDEAATTDGPLPYGVFPVRSSASGTVPSASSIGAALQHYEQRGRASQADKDALSELASFLQNNSSVSVPESILAYLLAYVSRQKEKGVLGAMIESRLVEGGLLKKDAQRLLNKTPVGYNGGGPAAQPDRSEDRRDNAVIDDEAWGPVWDLFSKNRIYEARHELQRRTDSGVQVLTKEWLERTRHVLKSAAQIDEKFAAAQRGLKAGTVPEVEKHLDAVSKVAPTWPGLDQLRHQLDQLKVSLRKQREQQDGLQAQQLLADAEMEMAHFNMPLAERKVEQALKLVGETGAVRQVQELIDEKRKDKFWGFRQGEPGEHLNPMINPEDLSGAGPLRLWSTWGVGLILVSVLSWVFTDTYTDFVFYPGLAAAAAALLIHRWLPAAKPKGTFKLLWPFLWFFVGLGLLSLAPLAFVVWILAMFVLKDMRKNRETVVALEKCYEMLQAASETVKESGPNRAGLYQVGTDEHASKVFPGTDGRLTAPGLDPGTMLLTAGDEPEIVLSAKNAGLIARGMNKFRGQQSTDSDQKQGV